MIAPEALLACYQRIAATRMQDIALNHPGLTVELINLRSCAQGTAAILIAPWMMNLVLLPSAPPTAAEMVVSFPAAEVTFRAVDADCGRYLSCSLFSPMTHFADRETVHKVADEIISALWRPPQVELSRRRLFRLS